jgi:hypothetical protein
MKPGEVTEVLGALARWALLLPLLPLAALRRCNPTTPWVIGGHRGRICEDNAGALHRHIAEHTDQSIVWITGSEQVERELAARGHATRRRGTLAAQWVILSAPVLIYSHGEDDLDPVLLLLRGLTGMRVYINHSQNHIKTGELYTTHYESLRGLRKRLYEWTVTSFDHLLASSERERRNFALSYPHLADRIELGGGAHVDLFLQNRNRAPGNTLFYFPTFRDTPDVAEQLQQTLRALVSHATLQQWLLDSGLTLRIGAHINTGGHAVEVVPPFELFPLARLKEAVFDCQAFISDYSGILGDFVAFDRPTVFFPFDRADYLRFRRLYVDYDELAFGPVVESVDALVELLTSERWRDMAPWAERRAYWRAEIFPTLEPVYARAGHEAIVRLLHAWQAR